MTNLADVILKRNKLHTLAGFCLSGAGASKSVSESSGAAGLA